MTRKAERPANACRSTRDCPGNRDAVYNTAPIAGPPSEGFSDASIDRPCRALPRIRPASVGEQLARPFLEE